MNAYLPIRTETYREPEELEHAIPGLQLRATPLAKGAFHARLVTWSLDGLVFQTGSCSPLVIEFSTGQDVSAFQVPLLNRQDLLLNGRLASGHAVGLYGGGAELLRANHLNSTYGTLVMPMHTVEALLCPPAGLAIARPSADAMLIAEARPWRRMAGVIEAASSLTTQAPGDLAAAAPLAGLRASLLDAARAVLEHGTDTESVRRLNARQGWARIVREADAYLRAHAHRAIYTEELCTQLGVSPASLAEAFRQVMGTTPHRFLKLRRMAMVRAALRSAEGTPPLVKSVALDHGFWHLGQFALDYRAMYGETPSATLARARGGTAASFSAEAGLAASGLVHAVD
jgi:AraC-like DNA-binding protein